MQVRWTSPAAQDLEDITLYIERDSESAARSVAKALFDAANSLDRMPARGRVGRIPGTRELVVPGLPYIVHYEVADTAVQILHIYHGARNSPDEGQFRSLASCGTRENSAARGEARMRRLRYGVAASLDGFIAGPNGEYDWIVHDPAIDFAAMFAEYDMLLMGRGTYEVASAEGKSWDSFGQRWIVVSTTLKPEDHPNVTILSSGVAEAVAALKAQPGPPPRKDVWLFGGGVLFRSLLDAGLVDTVEVALIPVMLGSGVPLLPEGRRRSLHLTESKALPSGILMLKYSVVPGSVSA